VNGSGREVGAGTAEGGVWFQLAVSFLIRRLGQFPTARSGWLAQDTGPRQSGRSVDGVSDDDQLQLWSDSPEIVGIAGYHRLPGPPRTNDDVGIDDVGRPGSCQQ